jgi:protein-histidine pros-kinase
VANEPTLDNGMRALGEAAFRQLVEAAPDAIVIAGRDGRIAFVNHQTETMFGYARDELLGQSVEILVPEHLRVAHLEHRDAFSKAPHARPMGANLDLHARRKDGVEFPVEISLSPLGAGGGDLVATTIRDVSERRKEVEISRETQRLKEMNEFRARFINMAAHELKTPLTPIRIQSRLLATVLSKGMEPEQLKAVASLDRNVERLLRLVEDILDAARVQATQLRLRPEPIDLNEVINESVESYRPVSNAVGVRIDWSPGPPITVLADRQRLLQVVNNVLNNALKFTGKSGRIDLRTSGSAAGAIVTIRDTGRGMDPAQIEKLFQPFSQVHGDVETTKGTGLGLFICKGILEEHGGSIGVASPGPGLGSTFTLRIPLSPGAPAPKPSPPSKSRVLEDRIRDLI